ncbi:MAG: PAS domain S-box protein, partial [Gemmatimonadetes bacterium]|nr:PAS domain S-box protein [Gemmatimonadota bacterium]
MKPPRPEDSIRGVADALPPSVPANPVLALPDDWLDLNPGIVVILDPAGRVLRVNPAFERLTGFQAAEVVGSDWFTTFIPDPHRARIAAVFRQSSEGIPTKGVINPIITRSGQEREIEWYDRALRGPGGDLLAIIAFGQDVTERVEAEREREAARHRRQARLDAIPITVAVLAVDGTVREIDQRTLAEAGDDANAIIGHPLWETPWYRATDGGHQVREAIERVARGDRARIEVLARTADGGQTTMDATFTPIAGPDGRVIEIVTTGIEVDERRAVEREVLVTKARLEASEARLREAQRVAQLGSWELDMATGALFWSDEIFRIFEIDKDRFPASYRGFLDLVHPDDRAAVDRAYQDSVARREPYQITHRLLFPDGRVKVVDERGLTHYADDGTPLRSVGTVQDVTERLRTIERLRASEQRYERVVRHISDALVIDDQDGRVVFANDRFHQLFGMPAEALGGVAIEDFLAPDDSPAFRARRRDMLAGRSAPVRGEHLARRHDGTRLWVEIETTAIIEEGVAVGTQSAIRDVTDRKLTEDALRFLSTRSARVAGAGAFDELAGHLARLGGGDFGFVVAYSSGAPRARRVGTWHRDPVAIAAEFDPADSPADHLRDGAVLVVADRVTEVFPECRRLQAAPVRGYAAVSLVDGRGRSIGYLGFASRGPLAMPDRAEALLRLFAGPVAADLDRLRTEARFANLFESSTDGILFVNDAGTVVACNRRAEELFGYDRHALVGAELDQLVPERLRPRHATARRAFFATGASRPMGLFGERLAGLRVDGTEFPVDISLVALDADEGPLVVATVRDTSAKVEAERERRFLETQLLQDQKLKAIGTLAAGIAHDFNNILTGILGAAELAEGDREAPPRVREWLREIKGAGRRAADLVNQILAFSRQQPPSRSEVSLRSLIDEVVRLLRASIPAGVEIRTRLAPDAPAVEGDASQLHQVLMNLCTNAWQAMPDYQGRIDIELARVDLGPQVRPAGLASGIQASVTIRDSGAGVDPAIIERIFDPFFTTKPVGKGTGLGLSVVHGIVKSHGGSISVQSEPGVGTTFRILLPAAPAHGGASATPRGRSGLPQSEPRARVLYVDDEDLLVSIAVEVLRASGYVVTGVV